MKPNILLVDPRTEVLIIDGVQLNVEALRSLLLTPTPDGYGYHFRPDGDKVIVTRLEVIPDGRASLANLRQPGGDHYKRLPVQTWDFIHRNGIGFLAGNVIKYVSRYKGKGGKLDLEKAQHYLEKLIEEEGKRDERQAQ